MRDGALAGERHSGENTVFAVLIAIRFSHLLNDAIQSVIPAIYPILKASFHLNQRFVSRSCSNASGNSGTEQGCQLTCSAIRLNHGFAASLRPRKTRCLPTRIEISELLMRFDPEQYRVHESAADPATPFEHD
jgi:hypothetical protein